MNLNLFKHDPEHLKCPILIPLGIVMAFLLIISLAGVIWVQMLHVRQEVQSRLNSVQRLYQGMQEQEGVLVNSLLERFEENRELQKAFLARDRDALLRIGEPILKSLKAKYNITHFYFIDPDLTCFFRVHNPSRYGDFIDRFTLAEAMVHKAPAIGTELGRYGTMTLRVVHPYMIDGRLAGYIEMGKEIEHITPEIKAALNVELIVSVNIKHLEKEQWEEGLHMMGRTGKWEEFPRHVVIDSTMPDVPESLSHYIALPHSQKEGLLFKVPMGEKDYRGGFIPLKEANGREIGEIIFLKDFTEGEHSIRRLSLVLVSVSVTLVLLLFSFFYMTITRIEGRLQRSRENLNQEISDRIKAEEQATTSLKEKELLLREIHHRVKNNMQIVSSLFRLQLRQIDNPKVREILHDSQSRINAMALVHKALYQPQNLSGVNFRDYIRELGLNLFDCFSADPEKLELVTDVEQISMDIDTAIPCGLIINELVTNAMKHAFPDGQAGKIWLSLKLENGVFTLTVRDNGIGIPEAMDIYNVNSLGMQLVVNLTVNQLQGNLEIHRGEGTEFVITFKETSYKKRL